jgi:hypothetical protein
MSERCIRRLDVEEEKRCDEQCVDCRRPEEQQESDGCDTLCDGCICIYMFVEDDETDGWSSGMTKDDGIQAKQWNGMTSGVMKCVPWRTPMPVL